MMSQRSLKLQQCLWRGMVCMLAAALSAFPALASGAGPNGINIGFNFNWASAGEPLGQTASFIQTVNGSGATLNNCGGPVNATTQACDFVFTYSIGGVAQPPVVPGAFTKCGRRHPVSQALRATRIQTTRRP